MPEGRCPNREMISAYRQGHLSADEAAAVAAHVDSCLDCQKSIDALLARYRDINTYGRRIKTATETKDPQAFSDALLASWEYALRLF